MTDPLSDFLRLLKPRFVEYFGTPPVQSWGFSVPASVHASIYGVHGGCIHYKDDTGSLVLKTGDLLIVRGIPHEMRSSPVASVSGTYRKCLAFPSVAIQSSNYMRMVTFEFDAAASRHLRFVLPSLMHLPSANGQLPEWTRILAGLTSYLDGVDFAEGRPFIGDKIAEIHFACAVLSYLKMKSGTLVAPGTKQQRIIAALNAVRYDPSFSWSIQNLAREAGMSRSVFTKMARTVLGEGPMRYVMRLRMQLAADILLTLDMKIVDIASFVGYESMPGFVQAFNSIYGTSPSAYRRQGSPGRDKQGSSWHHT